MIFAVFSLSTEDVLSSIGSLSKSLLLALSTTMSLNLLSSMPLLIALVLVIASLGVVNLINRLFKLQVVNNQFRAIEGLRGYLAFFVFIHHMALWYNYLHMQQWHEPPAILFNQFESVNISFFFMITGFLFSYKLINQTQTNWLLFSKKRVGHLLPLYLLNVLLVGASGALLRF